MLLPENQFSNDVVAVNFLFCKLSSLIVLLRQLNGTSDNSKCSEMCLSPMNKYTWPKMNHTFWHWGWSTDFNQALRRPWRSLCPHLLCMGFSHVKDKLIFEELCFLQRTRVGALLPPRWAGCMPVVGLSWQADLEVAYEARVAFLAFFSTIWEDA